MIENQILTYILHEKKVCLEGIGGFIAKEIPSFYNVKGKSFIPPTIKIFFSENLECNNTQFLFYLAEQQSVSFLEAKKQFDTFLSQIHLNLKNGQPSDLGILGKLIRKENSIEFIPSSVVKDLERFGFEELPAAGIDNEISRIKLSRTINPSAKKYIAAASIIFSLLFIPTNKPSTFNTASISFIGHTNINTGKKTTNEFIDKVSGSFLGKTKALFPDAAKKTSSQQPLEPTIKEHLSQQPSQKAKPEPTKKDAPAKTKDDKNTISPYYGIVIGAFKEKANADKLKAQYEKRFDITIKKVNGLYRVMVGHFETKEQAIDFIGELTSIGLNGWISRVR
jgi:cell division septation protein DedD